jgi:hydroxymethylbilane synthase
MARSGLERVGLASRIARDFTPQEMLPAVGQGIVAVECAAHDWASRRYLSLIDDPAAHLSCDAEREVLWVLNGHCNSPIAGYSVISGHEMSLTASVLDEAGGQFIEVTRVGPADRPRELGRAVGLELLDKGAGALIEANRPAE